jgi:hypothetical protein
MAAKQTVVHTRRPEEPIPRPNRSETIPTDGNKLLQVRMPSMWERRCSMRGTPRLMEIALGDLVNLNRHKKRIERDRSAKQADTNRARFGRTKSEQTLEQDRSRRSQAFLDQHRIVDKDES